MVLLVVLLILALVAAGVTLLRYRETVGQLRIQQAYLEQLFETFPHALTLRDLNGRLIRANAEFSRLFRYSVQEAIGVDIDRLIGVPGSDPSTGIDRPLSSESRMWRQMRRRRRDGSLVDVSHTGRPYGGRKGRCVLRGVPRPHAAAASRGDDQRAAEAARGVLHPVARRVLLHDAGPADPLERSGRQGEASRLRLHPSADHQGERRDDR
jgi:PAS domain S-box